MMVRILEPIVVGIVLLFLIPWLLLETIQIYAILAILHPIKATRRVIRLVYHP
jgi:hypothetical protein